MTGSECQRRLDLDADAIGRHALAIVGAMHDEAPGRDRGQSGQARLHPIGGPDGFEDERIGGLRASRKRNEGAHRCLIGGFAEMKGNHPPSIAILRRRDHHMGGIEAFGESIEDVPGLGLAGRDQGAEARIRGGRRRSHRVVDIPAHHSSAAVLIHRLMHTLPRCNPQAISQPCAQAFQAHSPHLLRSPPNPSP